MQEARSSYRRILTDSARKLNGQGSQLGACIEKARPYYEARRLAKEVSFEAEHKTLVCVQISITKTCLRKESKIRQKGEVLRLRSKNVLSKLRYILKRLK